MDTQSYPNLDPKLKETYDRIMGTATSAKPVHHAANTSVHTAPASHAAAKSPTHPEQHSVHTDKVTSPPHHLSHIAYNAASGSLHEEVKKSDQKTNVPMMPIVLAVGGVLFFIFYAVFWFNFFGM
jgi:hypothetical protein